MDEFDLIKLTKSFAANVKNRRLDMRLSRSALARLSGVNALTIKNIERGRCLPMLFTGWKIAQTLKMSIESLFFVPIEPERKSAPRQRKHRPRKKEAV